MKDMLFIYNPHAGKGKIKNHLSDIVEVFVCAEYEVTIYPTMRQDDARRWAHEHGKDYDIVVCSGGDGTLNEVTSGLMLCKDEAPVIGYLPAGTMNDFASSMRIPKNMVKAAQAVVSGEPFAYDIGSLNEKFFTYVAGFGVFTNVSYETSQSSKNILGRVAYILSGIMSIPSVKSYKIRVEYEDTVIEDEFIYGMVTNADSVGGFKGITGKDVGLDDGLFEVTLIKRPKNIIELQHIINTLLVRDLEDEFIYSFHASKLKMFCEEEVAFTVDGEYGGSYKEAYFENHQQALSFITTHNLGNILLEDDRIEEDVDSKEDKCEDAVWHKDL